MNPDPAPVGIFSDRYICLLIEIYVSKPNRTTSWVEIDTAASAALDQHGKKHAREAHCRSGISIVSILIHYGNTNRWNLCFPPIIVSSWGFRAIPSKWATSQSWRCRGGWRRFVRPWAKYTEASCPPSQHSNKKAQIMTNRSEDGPLRSTHIVNNFITFYFYKNYLKSTRWQLIWN